MEYEETEYYKNPFTKHYIFPRLFCINSDGSAVEFLSKEQLEYYFRITKQKDEVFTQRKHVMIGNTCAKSHYFLTKMKSLHEKDIELTQLKTLDFPQNARYNLLRMYLKEPRIKNGVA